MNDRPNGNQTAPAPVPSQSQAQTQTAPSPTSAPMPQQDATQQAMQQAQAPHMMPPLAPPTLQPSSLLGLVGKAVMGDKQKKVRSAYADWSALMTSWDEAMQMAGGDQQKAEQLHEKMPVVQAILGDPKKRKNMAKALGEDWMNPEKSSVYSQGLKMAIKADKAGKLVKALRTLHLAHQLQPQFNQEQQQQFVHEGEQMIPKAGQPNPQLALEAAKEQRLGQEKEMQFQLQRQQIEQTGQLRLEQMRMRDQQFQMMLQERQINRQQMNEWRKDSLDERREYHQDMLDMRKQMAQLSGDPGDWLTALNMGVSFAQVPAKDKRSVVAFAKAHNVPIPRQLTTQENQMLDAAMETGMKVDQWLITLSGKEFQGADGKPSNQAFSTLWPMLKYKFGVGSPEASIISDLSRERWAAIAPLLHGVRRGDILRDIVQHTPNPTKDSPALMVTKLQRLKQSFEWGKQAILWGHGFRVDPQTGQPLQAPPDQLPPDQANSGTILMRAPNGQVSPVPVDQVDHYKSRGATVVNR